MDMMEILNSLKKLTPGANFNAGDSIGGIQKLSMVDYPGKIAATIFMNGCNLRCSFCHNRAIVESDQCITYQELEDFFKTHSLLDGIVISGGEPLRSDSSYFHTAMIAAMARKFIPNVAIKIDTNGTNANLLKLALDTIQPDYVAMDLKTDLNHYDTLTPISFDQTDNIKWSIQKLGDWKEHHPDFDYEFRTTLIHEVHTEDVIRSLGIYIERAPHYYLQNFVNSGDLVDHECKFTGCSNEGIKALLKVAREYQPNTQVRGVDLD